MKMIVKLIFIVIVYSISIILLYNLDIGNARNIDILWILGFIDRVTHIYID